MRHFNWRSGGAALLAVALVGLSAQLPARVRPLVPIEPIGAIVEAFRTSSIVGMNSGQEGGDARGSAFVRTLIRDPRITQMDDPLSATFVSLLEAAGTNVFVIRPGAIDAEAVRASWPVPSLALVRGTTFGAADEPSGPGQRFAVRNGTLTPIPREQWISVRVEDQQDAVLWLGPASARTIAPLSPALCDPGFVEMRSRRRALAGLLVFRLINPVSIEGGDAPGWLGARRKNIGHI